MFHRGQHKPIPDPNQSVSKAEDEFIKSDSVPDRPSQGLCVRPGYGLQGDKTVLWTNYFELRAPSSQLALNYYTMTVDPDANDRFPKGLKRQQLMKLMLVHDDFEAMRPTLLATDFNTILITRDPLCFDHAVVENNAAKIVIAFRPEGKFFDAFVPLLEHTPWARVDEERQAVQKAFIKLTHVENTMADSRSMNRHGSGTNLPSTLHNTDFATNIPQLLRLYELPQP